MRRILCLLPWLVLAPGSASAFERDALNVAESVAGIYSSVYFHEAGHALAYKLFGATDITVTVPREGTLISGQTTGTFTMPLTPEQIRLSAISGLLAANVAGEVVMQNKGMHSSPYAQSIVGTSLVSNLIHVKSYYTKIRGVNGYAGNDIDQYELAGGNPHLMSAVLVGYTLWTLQRMREKEIPLFYVNLRF